MSRAYSTYRGSIEVLVRKPEGRRLHEKSMIDRRIILKYIFKN
jgi:DNA/RNA endonuclease YhcR with UshA esterase domain